MDTMRSLDTDDMERALHALAPEDRARILSVGASFYRLTVKKRLERAERKVEGFEAKYHRNLHEIETTGYPILPTMPHTRIMLSGITGGGY